MNVEWMTSAPTFSHALMVIIARRHALFSYSPRRGTLRRRSRTYAYVRITKTWCNRRRCRWNVRRYVRACITKWEMPLAELILSWKSPWMFLALVQLRFIPKYFKKCFKIQSVFFFFFLEVLFRIEILEPMKNLKIFSCNKYDGISCIFRIIYLQW